MSASILHFTPRDELEPAANLRAFIKLCRESEVLGAKEQFAKNIWDAGYQKGQNKKLRVIFSTLAASKISAKEPCMTAPFLGFAKAMLVYLQDKRPVMSQARRTMALRCMEAALCQSGKGARPTALTSEILDTAVELARAQVTAAVAYRVAGQIELIAAFMNEKKFISFRQPWHHGLKKPNERSSRISPEAIKARQEKLPSAALLRALAGVFRDAREPGDAFISSTTALMLCAPERINEVLRLRRNCLVEGDGEFQGKLGLRWSGSKGFPDTTKWLPSAMADIAREAVSNLVRVSSPAREIAKWYTEHPDKIYLHDDAVHLRNARTLSTADIGLLLWGDETALIAASTWAVKTHNLLRHKEAGGRLVFLFEDVQRTILSMLPATFPAMPGDPGLLCQDAMSVMRMNELTSDRRTYLCMFRAIDYSAVTNHYGVREGRSIFARFGYTEDDGTAFRLQSHSLRHYLNMLAQTGGLSSAEIALFSGRKDQKQNRAYDHMTSDEVQAPISEALANGFTSELEPPQAERDLINRAEFRGLGLAAAHSTEYGWCQHDFASEPCQMYRDCINCEEQECIKGDSHKEANLRQLQAETELALTRARKALNAEEYGADTWVEHHLKTLNRVSALLAILEDTNVAVGARIRLDVSNAPLITKDNVHPVQFIRKSWRKAAA